MKTLRERCPLRSYQCLIAVSRRKEYISVGDLLDAMPAVPWLPEMAATPTTMWNYQHLIEIIHTHLWAKALANAGMQEASQAMTVLASWAQDVAHKARNDRSKW